MRTRLQLETLEQIITPTSTLYVDFGDNFPLVGSRNVLTDTLGNLKTAVNGANPSVNGPQLTDASGANYADATAFDFVSFASSGTVPTANQAAFRTQVLAFLQRAYEPLNITVVALTNTAQVMNGHSVQAASSLADISATLGLNEGDVGGDNDAYALLVLPELGATDDNPTTFVANAYNGAAPTTDIGIANNTDDTVLAFLNSTPNAAFIAAQIARQTGHAFGLPNAFGNNPASSPGIDATLVQSEAMSTLSAANFGGFNFFSRFPTVAGDGNLSNEVLNATPTPFDQFATDPQVGLAPNIQYVTGTGANDIITLAPGAAPNTVNVTVQPFSDAGYTTPLTVPGSAGTSTTYSYTLTLAANDVLIIDAGASNDRIIINGDLNRVVKVRGMHGTDELIVSGTGNATYTPGTNTANGLDGNADRRGTVAFGGTTINISEFELTSRVVLQNFAQVTFVSPGGVDDLSIGSVAGQVTVSGTVNGGVGFVPLTVATVAILDVDANVGDDTFKLLGTFAPPVGFTMNLLGGAGTDTVQFLSVSVPTLLRVNAVGAMDGFNILTGTFTGVMRDVNRIDAAGGSSSDIIFGRGANSLWLLQPGDDVYQDVGTGRTFAFTGFDNLAGGGMADEFRFLAGGTLPGNIDGYLGNDTIDMTAVAPQALTIDDLGSDNGYDLIGSTVNAQLWNVERVLLANGSSLKGRNVDALWNIQTGEDRYRETVSGRTLDFSGVANLTGGTGLDFFDFLTGGTLAGFVDGGLGNDTFGYNALGAQTTTLTATGPQDGFNGTNTLVPTGLRNINSLVGSLAGLSDRLVGLNVAAVWNLSATAKTYTASGRTLTFTQVEEFVGGTSSDAFTIDFSAGLPLPTTGGLLNALTGSDSLNVIVTAGNDAVTLTATVLKVNGLPLSIAGLERLDLRAGAGNDTITATALPGILTQLRIFGEAGNDRVTVPASSTATLYLDGGSGSDTLKVNRNGGIYSTVPPAKSVTSGTFLFKNRKAIQFVSFETRSSDGELQQNP